jgi:AcrR family transcriptional regulator
MTREATISRRERLREATVEEIKSVARQQMAEQGAAALSLRAIAAQMGMTAPALYGYFKSRDELVTALILDAYYALADTLTETAEGQNDQVQAILAKLLRFRTWALENKADFSLIFGTPIPGYHAPAELTLPAARKSAVLLAQALQAVYDTGTRPEIPVEPELAERLQAWQVALGENISPAVAYLSLVGWATLQGMLMLEIYGHLQFILPDHSAALYRTEVSDMLRRLGVDVNR